ncbi:MAG: glycosyltransferase family 2 protein [Gemmobacter sp.]
MAGQHDRGDRDGAVLRRRLAPAQLCGLRLLDAVAEAETGRLRAFWASGTATEAFAAGAPVEELRPIAGAPMLVASMRDPIRAATGQTLDIRPSPDERDLLAARNVLFGIRLAETAETVAEWLVWHAAHHGADAALVVNRADPAQEAPEGFAAALSDALAAFPDLRAVVVEPGVPLGRPDSPPETHPLLAPDAPGKDRMPSPPPDPWLAPLAEGVLPELLRWRFLGRARAVVQLDPCDHLTAEAGAAFDRIAAAPSGVVMLVGRRIYPWRVRQGRPARLADHICRPFDARRGIARWGVAPGCVGPENTWRMTRIAYARPDPGEPLPFWRAMALRVPGRATSELVPKTALIEDPALLAMAESLGHKPVRAPASRPRALTTDRTAIVTTMKNEAPFILEWLAYHRAIGIDDFLIYTNDCTDGTDTMLDLLQQKGLVQHRDNPFRSMDLKPQHAALQAAEDEEVIRAAGWTICMDVDEFIDIKLGDGRLPALYSAMEAALPGANMISLTWRLFGNSDVHGYEDRFLLEQFTRCAPEIVRKPHQAWGFKTLFRNIEIYKKLGVHRPKGLRPDLWDQVRWLNGSGRPMPREMFRNGWRSTLETYGYDWVSLNHYAVRSAESFLVKRDRGRVNHVDRDQGLAYWFRMNHNVVEDRSIQRHLPLLRAEWDRLMADADIALAHRAAVAAHRAKIAELRARSDQAEFLAALTGPRMERLSRHLPHFGSAVFNAGPQVVPDEIALAESLPEGFFFTVDHTGAAEH